MAAPAAPPRCLNVNVGVVGHVDAGKTSLVRALSTELSTAALDKHPQSADRGITLDLGFSAFTTDAPPAAAAAGFTSLQFTLVDCPGHASLIRTIIGGAQIIDMMVLVVDAVKGVQTQTAECLVIAEITTDQLVVVLNKVDLLPEAGRAAAVETATARVRKVLASTKFRDAPIIALAACPGGAGKMGAAAPLAAAERAATATAVDTAAAVAGTTAGGTVKAQGEAVRGLVELMKRTLVLPVRDGTGPFLFAVDHCFPIKGQGTVLTGTVLSGSVKVADMLELPELLQERRIKSMQMFHKPVTRVEQGDRAGICVAGLDASLIERGLACSPGAVPTTAAAIALIRKIRFFKGRCESESRFHVSVGHATVMATVVFWGAAELARDGVRSGRAAGGSADVAKLAAAAVAAADADTAAAAVVDEASAAGGDGGVASDAVAAAAGGASGGAGGSAATAVAGAGSAGAGSAASGMAVKAGAGAAAAGAAVAAPSADAKALAEVVARRSEKMGVPALPYDWSRSYAWQPALLGGRSGGVAGSKPAGGAGGAPGGDGELVYEWQWAALLFDSPIVAPLSSLVIGSHLDADIHANACRLAFYGRMVERLPSSDVHVLAPARLYKRKLKVGVVDRIDEKDAAGTVIGRALFKKETDMNQFVGLRLHTRYGQVGTLDSAFAKSGKFKAAFPDTAVVDLQVLAQIVEAMDTGVVPLPGGGGGAGAKGGAASAKPVAAAAAAAKVTAVDGGGGSAAAGSAAMERLPEALREALRAYQAGGSAAAGGARLVSIAGLPAPRPNDPLYLAFVKFMYAGGHAGAAGGKRAAMQQL